MREHKAAAGHRAIWPPHYGRFEVVMTDEVDTGDAGSISDAFKAEEPEVIPEPEPKGEPEEPKADEPGNPEETAPEPEPKAEPPSAEPESVPRRALLDERRKRQETEQQLKALKQKYETTDEGAPDPIDDPKGYESYLRGKWEKERFEEITNKSRDRMIEKHSDYEDMERHFVVMTQSDPDLIQKVKEHHDPAAFAYETAKASFSKTEADIEARIIARLEKEGRLKNPNDAKIKSASEVTHLIKSPGAGKNSDKSVKEITDIGDVFA